MSEGKPPESFREIWPESCYTCKHRSYNECKLHKFILTLLVVNERICDDFEEN